MKNIFLKKTGRFEVEEVARFCGVTDAREALEHLVKLDDVMTFLQIDLLNENACEVTFFKYFFIVEVFDKFNNLIITQTFKNSDYTKGNFDDALNCINSVMRCL